MKNRANALIASFNVECLELQNMIDTINAQQHTRRDGDTTVKVDTLEHARDNLAAAIKYTTHFLGEDNGY